MKSNFIQFLKAPKYKILLDENSFLSKVKVFGALLMLKILIVALIVTISFYLENKFNISSIPKRLKLSYSTNSSFQFRVFKVVFFAPVFEELLFRLVLRFSKINFSVFFALGTYFLMSIMKIQIFISISASMIVGLIIYFFLLKKDVRKRISEYYKKNFKFIFYFSSFLFAFTHLRLFEINKETFIWIPFILTPYFLSALIYGYIRIKNGIICSILMHTTYNFLLITLRTL